MFGHAVAFFEDVVCDGVGIVVHKSAPHAEHLIGFDPDKGGPISAFCVSQYRGASPFGDFNGSRDSKGAPSGVSIQPSFTGDLEISLILRIKGGLSVAALEGHLSTRRIAGGIIAKHGRVEACDSIDAAFSKIRTGHLLVDKSELLKGKDVLSCFYNAMSEKLPDGRRRAPAGMGYSLVTPAKVKVGARNDLPHAYAESVSGIVEYVPIRRATPEERNNLWLPCYIDEGVLVVKQFSSEE